MRGNALKLLLIACLLLPLKVVGSPVSTLPEGQTEMFDLLKEWCDALVEHQLIHSSENIDGGMICPGCAIMHGRAADAIYPLLYMANKTGESHYLRAAEKVFAWGETNVAAPDSSWYNDVNFSSWKGITVFNVIVLGETLKDFGHLLAKETYDRWQNSLKKQATYIYKVIRPGYGNVNYPASTCYALTLAAEFTGEEKYKTRAKELSHSILEFFTPNNSFIFGEGNPYVKSPKGLFPVDLGYNVEETLPNLMWYAEEVGDSSLKEKIKQSMDTHIRFMLPDGAWDNSWGTRNYKWSYWGSRTSDGCIALCNLLAKTDPIYAEVGYRNFELLKQCTHNGLLYGGMHYVSAGYPACLHHTFEHAKSLALALKHGFTKPESRMKLPSEKDGTTYFEDLDLWTITTNGWRATLTGYDVDYHKTGGNAHGGTLSLLWNQYTGPLLAAAMTEYTLEEPANMQMRKGMQNYNSTFHIFYQENGTKYTSIPFKNAMIEQQETTEGIKFLVRTELQTKNYQIPDSGSIPLEIIYWFKKGEIEIQILSKNKEATDLKAFIPLISVANENYHSYENGFYIEKPNCDLSLTSEQGTLSLLPVEQNGRAFNPVPGFEFLPFELSFNGEARLKIEIREK